MHAYRMVVRRSSYSLMKLFMLHCVRVNFWGMVNICIFSVVSCSVSDSDPCESSFG